MESHRRLLYLYPADRWLFLTCHLHGSLPHSQSPPPAKVSAGRVFVWIDRYLDRGQRGPQFLRQAARRDRFCTLPGETFPVRSGEESAEYVVVKKPGNAGGAKGRRTKERS